MVPLEPETSPPALRTPVIRFGELELDSAKRELRQGFERIELEPKALDLLLYLLENRHRIVSKEELLEAVWGTREVFESSLTSCMSRLRHALGDHGGLIRTQYGKGYRIIDPREERNGAHLEERRMTGLEFGPPAFVGRELELARLGERFERARRGSGGLVLVHGIQGIGKTRLVEELRDRLQPSGRVLHAGWPEGAAEHPYWAWIKVLRAYMTGMHADTLRFELGSGARDVVALVPEMRAILPEATALGSTDAEGRPRLFQNVTSFLRHGAHREPILLILEDLQWADRTSLQLLRHFASAVRESPILVIATYRDPVPETSPLRDALASLLPLPECESLVLDGLSRLEVEKLVISIAGRTLGPSLIGHIADATKGTPFLVEQVTLHVVERRDPTEDPESVPFMAGLPESIATAQKEQILWLRPGCRRILSIASAIGVRFNVDLVNLIFAEESGLAPARAREEIQAYLDEASEARALRPSGEGEYSFVHPFLREFVYRGLSLVEQAALHQRIGDTMEATGSFAASEVADQFVRGAAVAGVSKTLVHVERAAEAAEATFAFEQAVRWYRKGLSILELTAEDSERQQLELLIRLARAEWNAGMAGTSAETAARAAELARRLGDGTALARAALARGCSSTQGAVETSYARTLEEAASALGPNDASLEARVLGRLAWAYYYARDRGAKRTEFGRRALALARGLEDPPSLLWTLCELHSAFTDPDHSDERLGFANEIIALADAGGDRDSLSLGYAFRAWDLAERGEMDAADRDMSVSGAIAEEVNHPVCRWRHALWLAMRALREGRWNDAERLARSSHAIGRELDPELAELRFRSHFLIMQLMRGRLEGLDVQLEAILAAYPLLQVPRAALAYHLALSGRIEQAVQVADQVLSDGVDGLLWDSTLLPTLVFVSFVHATAGDRPRCAELYDLLAPYRGQIALLGVNASVCFGPVSRPLGWLAASLGRHAEAEAHQEATLDTCRRIGARPWLAETCVERARALLVRGGPADRERAAHLLHEARTLAADLALPTLMESIATLA